MPGPRIVPRIGKRGGASIADLYKAKVLALSPAFAFWMEEASGPEMECAVTPSNNGAYADLDAVTLGAGTGPAGTVCPFFDGTDLAYGQTTAAGLVGAFNTNGPFTMLIWYKPYNAAIWTDSTARSMAGWAYNSNSRCHIARTTTDNQIEAYFRNLNLVDRCVNNLVDPGTDWHASVYTGDAPTLDEMSFWDNGVEADISPTNSLQAYSHALAEINAGISRGGQSDAWYGWLWGFCGWTSVLSDANIVAISSIA